MKKEMKINIPTDFCDGCCYNENLNEKLKCNKVQCCYLVRKHCILKDGYIIYEYS